MGQLTKIMLGILIFSGLLIGFNNFYIEVANSQGLSVSNISYMSKISEVYSSGESIKSYLESGNFIQTTFGIIFLAGDVAIRSLIGTIQTLIDIITGSQTLIPGVPNWVFSLIITAVIIYISIKIISVIRGKSDA